MAENIDIVSMQNAVLGSNLEQQAFVSTGPVNNRTVLNSNIIPENIKIKAITNAINALYNNISSVNITVSNVVERMNRVVGNDLVDDKTDWEKIGANLIQAIAEIKQNGGGSGGGITVEDITGDGEIRDAITEVIHEEIDKYFAEKLGEYSLFATAVPKA